jgi:hypothetical protein
VNGPPHAAQTALLYELEVLDHGRLELEVPLDPGARVVVFVVLETDDRTTDLVAAASSGLGFWDNPVDDEEWNDA